MQKQADRFEEKLYFVQHNDDEDIARITEELNGMFEKAMQKAAVSNDNVKKTCYKAMNLISDGQAIIQHNRTNMFKKAFRSNEEKAIETRKKIE